MFSEKVWESLTRALHTYDMQLQDTCLRYQDLLDILDIDSLIFLQGILAAL